MSFELLPLIRTVLNVSTSLASTASKSIDMINKHRDSSGDVLISKIVLKCLDICVEPKLIDATLKDINDNYDLNPNNVYTKYKLFIDKMIDNIYEYKHQMPNLGFDGHDPEFVEKYDVVFGVITVCTFFEIMPKVVTKDLLTKNIIEYMNCLKEDDLNSGRKLYFILVNVFTETLIKKYNGENVSAFSDEMNDMLGGFAKILKSINETYEYKSPYYEEAQICKNDEVNIQFVYSSSDDEDTAPNKKRKFI